MKRSLVRLLTLVFLPLALGYGQQPTNTAQIAGTATSTGNGVAGAGVQRVTIASDNTAFAVNATLSAETTKVIGTVRSVGNVGGVFDTTAGATAAANSVEMGGVYNSSAPSPSSGQQEPLQLDSSANLKVNCITGCGSGGTVTLVPATSGGLSMKHFVAAASDNATNLKASAGQVYSVDIYNAAAYPVYFKLVNKASSPTCGTDTNVKVVGVQAGTQHILQSEQGWALGTGISYCLVKGIADSDDTSVLLSDATVDLGYK